MTDRLNKDIGIWIGVSKGTLPAALQAYVVDHDKAAKGHDAQSAKHSKIAGVLRDASKGTADPKSAANFASAAKANQHAADVHNFASFAHRGAKSVHDESVAADASEKAKQASLIANNANDSARQVAENQSSNRVGKATVTVTVEDDDSSSSSSSSSSSDNTADEDDDSDGLIVPADHPLAGIITTD